jgi:hypothetical protein
MANKHCLLVVVSVEVKVVVAILAGEATAVDAKKSARYRKFLHANKKKKNTWIRSCCTCSGNSRA